MGFLGDYLTTTGVSEVPQAYHKWVGLVTLAAVLQDRVYMMKGQSRIRPNLYVFLIGPSGIGKDTAIDHSFRLLRDFAQVPVLYGRVTAASLIDTIAARKNMPIHHAKLLLATPELAMSVGRGTMADDLVKFMTALYGGSEVPLIERTRTSGRHTIRNHCLNWVAGTTADWMRDCITREAVEGGFFARVACVQAKYNLANRISEPTLHSDHEACQERVRDHIKRLLAFEAEIKFDVQAEQIRHEWYCSRPEPADPVLTPSWKREDDTVRKLAMILAMSEPDLAPVIRAKHLVEAQRLTQSVISGLPGLLGGMGIGSNSEGLRRVRGILQDVDQISHTALAGEMARHGITHDELRKYMDTLIDARLVHRDKHSSGWAYRWRRRPSMEAD